MSGDPSVQTFDIDCPQKRLRMLQFGVTPGAAQVETIDAPAVASATQADFVVIYNKAGESEALWLDIDANGTAPTAAEYTAANVKTKVSVATGDTAIVVAAAMVAAITIADVTVVDNLDGSFSLTQDIYGDCSDAACYNANGTGAGSIVATVDVNGVDVSLGNGKFDGVATQTAIGVMTITFNQQFLRAPEVGVTSKTDNRVPRVTACTISAVTIEMQNLSGGAAADGSFSLLVIGSDTADFVG